MRRIVLVRHGETPWNTERRLQGQRDIGLSPAGLAQVERLAPFVQAHAPDLVVSSPLLRCRQTADALGVTPHRFDGAWKEADLGLWTGRTRAELVAAGDGAYARWRSGAQSPPQGESLEHLEERVGAALAHLRTVEAETVLVLTHGGPVRAAVRLLLGLPRGRVVPVAPATLTAFDVAGEHARLEAYNLRPEIVPTDGPAGGPEADPPD